MNNKKPAVIVFEGGEGAGKTTAIQGVSKLLKEQGVSHVVTREPGGVEVSERIRDILLHCEMDMRTEALLFAAARREHLVKKILPALEGGNWVLMDRFVESSLVYQGFVRGIGIDSVYAINHFAIESFTPDITLFFDLPAEMGLSRIEVNKDREVNRLDRESIAFHQKIREGYLSRMQDARATYVRIDASLKPEDILTQVMDAIEPFL